MLDFRRCLRTVRLHQTYSARTTHTIAFLPALWFGASLVRGFPNGYPTTSGDPDRFEQTVTLYFRQWPALTSSSHLSVGWLLDLLLRQRVVGLESSDCCHGRFCLSGFRTCVFHCWPGCNSWLPSPIRSPRCVLRLWGKGSK